MTVVLLNVLRIRWLRNESFISISTKSLQLVWRFFKGSGLVISDIFNKSNSVRGKMIFKDPCEKITIICVATKKDFLTLPNVIMNGVKAVGRENLLSIRVVVPERYFSDVSQLLKDTLIDLIVISTDEETVPLVDRNMIKAHFRDNSSWILQQLVKFESVRNAKCNVLILDADTLILNPDYLRVVDGVQALTPTEEFNKPYYNFLEKISPIFMNSIFSFVPHHLIVQQEIFEEMCHKLKIDNVSKLVNLCIKHADVTVQAPLCIDYELYAQYLFAQYPHRFVLIKWSNISVSRVKYTIFAESKIYLFVLRKLYNSISFHSWS